MHAHRMPEILLRVSVAQQGSEAQALPRPALELPPCRVPRGLQSPEARQGFQLRIQQDNPISPVGFPFAPNC